MNEIRVEAIGQMSIDDGVVRIECLSKEASGEWRSSCVLAVPLDFAEHVLLNALAKGKDVFEQRRKAQQAEGRGEAKSEPLRGPAGKRQYQ